MACTWDLETPVASQKNCDKSQTSLGMAEDGPSHLMLGLPHLIQMVNVGIATHAVLLKCLTFLRLHVDVVTNRGIHISWRSSTSEMRGEQIQLRSPSNYDFIFHDRDRISMGFLPGNEDPKFNYMKRRPLISSSLDKRMPWRILNRPAKNCSQKSEIQMSTNNKRS